MFRVNDLEQVLNTLHKFSLFFFINVKESLTDIDNRHVRKALDYDISMIK